MSLPLGVAPSYAVVGGISAQGHEGPGPGNSIFGARHTEFDRPWLATLSGRRNMQPNVAHQIFRVDDDGVVRDPLGSGMAYRHDGYVAAAESAPVPPPYPPYVPAISNADLQTDLNSSDPAVLLNLVTQIDELRSAIESTQGLDPNQVEVASSYLGAVKAEYQAALTSGFDTSHATPQSTKFVQDAVSALASYANIYNETDLFPDKEAGATNAMVQLLNYTAGGTDAVGTLFYFMDQVAWAYGSQRGRWMAANTVLMGMQSGAYDPTEDDYNFADVGTNARDLLTKYGQHDQLLAIANNLVSGLSGSAQTMPVSNPPWGGSSGQAPSIWGTYLPTGSGTPSVVNDCGQFDEAVFDAAAAVRKAYLAASGQQPSGGGGGGGKYSPGTITPPAPPEPSNNEGLIAAALAAALGALVYKAYA